MMTKKHFKAIAEAINEQRNGDGIRDVIIDQVSHNIMRSLIQFNSNFDRERFLTACGVK